MKIACVLLLCFTCIVVNSMSQSVDYNKIILPDGASNISFEERLVQIAWQNNPQSIMATEGVKQALQDGKVSTTSWSQLAGVTGNLNEFSIKEFGKQPATTTGQVGTGFYPRYNIFANIPLSLFVQNPHARKVAQSKVIIAQGNVNLTKLSLRSTVLKLYSDYKKNELILLVRRQSASDDESNYLLIEQKFKNGELLVDDYIRAQRNRNDLKIQLAIAESEFRKSKLDLEEIIGMRLEDVK